MSYQALLFCPDEKTARVVTQVLSELDFTVEAAHEPFAAVKKLMAQRFDAIVVDCENEQNATLMFKSARNSSSNQASLAVAVVEGQAGVANAFRIGANLVLTKPINIEQSKGTLRVARGLLRKGAEGKTPAGPPPAGNTDTSAPASHEFSASTKRTVPTVAPATSASGASMPKPSFTDTSAQLANPSEPMLNATAPIGSLEKEADQGPKPDASDTAALESMHDARVPGLPPAPAASEQKPASKTYPWQPVAKNAGGPMATALQRAAEAAGKAPTPQAAEGVKAATTKPVPPAKLSLGSTLAHGTATAPAPAKEQEVRESLFENPAGGAPAFTKTSMPGAGSKSRPTAQASAAMSSARLTSPSFSTLDAKDEDEEDTGSASGTKTPLMGVAAVALLAMAGYFGYTMLHGKASQPASKSMPSQTAPAVPAASVPAVEPTAVPPAGPSAEEQSGNDEPAPAPATQKNGTSTSKPSAAVAAKSASAAAVAEDKTVIIARTEPIKVQSNPARRAAAEAGVDQDQAAPIAPSLAMGSDPSALSSIVANTPASVPSKPAPQVVKVSQGVSQGLLLKKVQPSYPPQALTMHVQGAVVMQATISKDGSITNLKVLSGETLLNRAAMDAVRQWKYKPYYLDGEPVEIQTQITVNFKLPN
jgi:protein TonB